MNTALKTNANASTAIAALGNLKAGLANVQGTIRNSAKGSSGEPILRLGRDGKWVYGGDNVDVEDGSEWALNPLSLRHGFICWKKIPEGSKAQPELYGEHTFLMTEPLPSIASLQAHDKDGHPVDHGEHPWTEEILIDVACISGEDAGEQTIYKPSSTGGMRAMREFLDTLNKQIDSDPEHPVAVVRLDSDSYKHPQYGKTYFPVLKIVRWASLDETITAPAGNGVEQEPEKAPAKEPEPAAPQEQTAAPTGERRRRRAA